MEPFGARFEKRCAEFLRNQARVSKGESIIVAVSGGVDSMTLLHLLHLLSGDFSLGLVAAHLNHGLRGSESDGDEQFVLEAAARYGIRCVTDRVDCAAVAAAERLSVQAAARKVRYAFLECVRAGENARAIATAHHADDNAETVLLNILRGAGLRGAAGIPVRRFPGPVIRPLLFARRQEIEDYAREQDIRFREDSSNSSLKYARNFLRNRLMPEIERELQPGLVETLNRFARTMSELDQFAGTAAAEALRRATMHRADDQLILSLPALAVLPPFLLDQVLLELLRRLECGRSEERIDALAALCDQESGSRLDLDGGWRVMRDRETLRFEQSEEGGSFEQPFAPGSVYSGSRISVAAGLAEPIPEDGVRQPGCEFIDAALLREPLILRTWRAGDWFMPLGMQGRKKISDFFVDDKTARSEKLLHPVLESAGDIVWVCGKRIDERYKVTTTTTQVIRLRYERTDESKR